MSKPTQEQMEQTMERYFELWQTQDAEHLDEVFTPDAVYQVKPFGVEVHSGLEAIRRYWQRKVVELQIDPKPEVLKTAYGDDFVFAEWEHIFTTHEGSIKTLRGILLLEFEGPLVKELREHYAAKEQ